MKQTTKLSILLNVIFFSFFHHALPAGEAAAFVSVSGYQQQQQKQASVAHVHRMHEIVPAYRDHRYQQYQQMIKNDHAVRTKYYTDAGFRAKVDALCQILYKCNSPFFFERVWGRLQLMLLELSPTHQIFLQTMHHEFAARYFDGSGKLINTEYDDSFGLVCADLFKWTFNDEDYQSKLNILHDPASLELIAYEKKGFFSRGFQVIKTTVSNVSQRLFSVFKSQASPAQVRDNHYNKQLLNLIEHCKRGEFSKAESYYIPGDQLMDKLWNYRATICHLSGGTSEHFENSVDLQQLKNVPSFVEQNSVFDQQVAQIGEHLDFSFIPQERQESYLQALQEAQQNLQWTDAQYNFPQETKNMLADHLVDPSNYYSCFGHQFMQLVHQDELALLNKTAKLYHGAFKQYDNFFVPSIISHTELGREHNQIGLVKAAVLYLSIGWALYEQAQQINHDILLGMKDGVVDVGTNICSMLQDPKATVLGIGHTVIKIGKIFGQLIDIATLNMAGRTLEEIDAWWLRKWERLSETAQALKNHLAQSSVRDLARSGTSFALEMILFEKSMGVCGKFFKDGVQKLGKLIRTIEDATQATEMIATTAEGIAVEVRTAKESGKLARAADNVQKTLKNAGKAIASSKPVATALERMKCFKKFEEIFKKTSEAAMRALEHDYLILLENGKTIKEFTSKVIKDYWGHIFSEKHMDLGIMYLGLSQAEIVESAFNIIKAVDKSGRLQHGVNTICVTINGQKSIVKVILGSVSEVINVDIYKITSANPRLIGNVIYWG